MCYNCHDHIVTSQQQLHMEQLQILAQTFKSAKAHPSYGATHNCKCIIQAIISRLYSSMSQYYISTCVNTMALLYVKHVGSVHVYGISRTVCWHTLCHFQACANGVVEFKSHSTLRDDSHDNVALELARIGESVIRTWNIVTCKICHRRHYTIGCMNDYDVDYLNDFCIGKWLKFPEK